MDQQKEERSIGQVLRRYVRKEFFYIVLCMVSIIICLAAYLNTQIPLAKCNEYYQQEFAEHCRLNYEPPNYTNPEAMPVLNISNYGVGS